jgi:4-hydroxybenzoate polyprenyltransferase
MSAKLKALLATGRVSNLPTVWCNCLVAALIIFHSSETGYQEFIQQPWSLLLTQLAIFLVFISSFFYVGGCFMGDYYDKEFDAKHKPERPIPSGVLSENTVMGIGIPLMLTALIGGILIPQMLIDKVSLNHLLLPVLLLFLTIQNYSRYHKKSLFIGLPLIGLCRFFLIIFAASSTAAFIIIDIGTEILMRYQGESYFMLPIIIYAAAVCIYTIAFASVARTESSDSPITWRNLLRYTMLGLPLTVLFSNQSFQTATIVALIIYALWLTYAFSFLSKNKGNYVSKCLAGFCLLDACFVAQFGWIWVIICLILFVIALALQRIAPAT